MKTALVVLVLAVAVALTRAELADLECPEDCDCYYFRINWVTDCSSSNLSAVPSYEEGLSSNVYILNMNENNLTRLDTFPEDIKLRSLQVAGNNLTELRKEYFKGLLYLLDADFSGNQIGKVDPESFWENPGFISLDLHNNPLRDVDGPFLSSRSLLNLDLSDCRLTSMSPHFFANATALNKLDLSGNALSSVDTGVFDPLTSLEELRLNRCNLTRLTETAFAALGHLKLLELSFNKLTQVDWMLVLGPLRLLESLDLRHSAITNLPAEAFSNNSWLRTLVLAENELRDLDVATTLGHNLLQLNSLDLSYCNLRGPLSEDAFANATKLRTLLLSGNRLTGGDLSVALGPLTKLHRLSLRNCGISRLPNNSFDHLTSLEELDISSNPLNKVFTGILSPLETLQILDMSNSNLSHISVNTFSKMTHLKRLVLSGNRLTDLEYGLFQNLTKMEVLELNDCGLEHPPDAQVFSNDQSYANLQELRLAGNPLVLTEGEPLLPRQFSGLRTLDISRCNITRLPRDLFATTPNITSLSLAGNLLGSSSSDGSFDSAFLENVASLESLDVSYCNLSRISPQSFAASVNLSSLKLVGNPWKCDCYIADMWSWASATRGNLAILDGATVAPEGPARRKKPLSCHYDGTLSVNQRPRSRLRHRDIGSERTWARFVKEADCGVRPRTKRSAMTGGDVERLGHVAYTLPAVLALAVVGGLLLVTTRVRSVAR